MIKKILIGVGAALFVLFALVVFSYISARNETPPQLVAHFVDLDKIVKVSKYRSCAGHVTIPQDERESKRSMKHYLEVKAEYARENTVEIYAPYDGYVMSIREEPELNLEGEIWIAPDRKLLSAMPPFGVWVFSVQHINVRDDLKRGDKVSAGEIIGHAAFSNRIGNTFDIVYGKMGMKTKRIDNWTSPFSDLDSVFYHLSEKVYAGYRQKGLTKENITISKEDRDQNHCVYKDNGPYFMTQKDEENWIVLQ